MTWGFSRPVLVLPADAKTWPEDRVDSVVLHELAHIERRDWLAGIVAQLACALYWFNPFVWAIRKRMEVESETAADDRVLNTGISATQYAFHLVGVTRDLRAVRSSTEVALAMARPGSLDRRIRAILEASRCRTAVRGVVAFGLIASVTGLVIAVGAATPTRVHGANSVSSDSIVSRSKSGGNRAASGDIANPTTLTPEPAADGAESGDYVLNSDVNFSTTPGAAAGVSIESTHSQSAKQEAKAAEKASTPPDVSVTVARPNPSLPRQVTSGVQSFDTEGKVSKDEWDGIPDDMKIDLKDLEADLKRTGVEVSAETANALKQIPNIAIDTRGIMNLVTRAATTSTRAALESAKKVANAQIAEALHDLKRKGLPKLPPPGKQAP
jgi:hypothetical protein